MGITGFNRLTERCSDFLNRQKNRKLLWFGIYTAVFLVSFFGVFATYFIEKRTFIWYIDGSYQMMPWLSYAGKWVLRATNSLAHHLPVPLYDICLGWGDDIIGYLGSNGQMEPIAALLSALTPLQNIETLFAVLLGLRLYASGLAFLYMCRYFEKDPVCSLAGALVYLFNGYSLFCGTAFPYFLNAMVLLPLLIVGADRILRRKPSGLFIFTTFYAGLCGFYLLYMLSAIVAVFALIRFFDLCEKGQRLRAFPRLLFRALLHYAIGIGLAAPVLFPAFAALFASARSNYNNFYTNTNPLAHWRTFWERFLALAAPKAYYEADWGVDFHAYAAVFLPALALLFLRKRRKTLKWLAVITLLAFFCPVGGWVMNGFQYSSNRWSFGVALLAGVIVAEMLPDLLAMNRREVGIMLLMVALYAAVGISSSYMRVSMVAPVGATFLTITLLVTDYASQYPAGTRRALCVLLVGINVCVNALYTLSPDGMNWISKFNRAENEFVSVIFSTEADADHFLYYDEYKDGRFDSASFRYNNAMYFDFPGTLFYSSTINGNPVRFLEEMENSGNQQNFKVHSTDQRTMMDTLLSVKYFLEKDEKADYVPYGYRRLGETYTDRSAYINEYALPWGYTYSASVAPDEIAGMNGIQKQQALMQAVALEGGDSGATLVLDEERVPYTVECEDCEWKNGVLKTAEGGTITVKANLVPGREYYVRLKNLDVESYKVSNRIINTWGASFDVYMLCGDMTKSSRAESTQYTCYYGRNNYLFNLGCSDEIRDSATIYFPVSGTFGLEDIELYALPMTHYEAWVDALREEPLENIKMDTNRISGTVDLSKNKILCLTVPYSKGWTAYVDGQRTDILKVNYAFMGLDLPAGHHEIVFEYFTPGLKLGLILCGVSLCAACVMYILVRKGRFDRGTV